MKGTGHLNNIFTDTTSIEHNRVFNPYTARTLVNMWHDDKQEDKMLDWQTKGVSAGTNVTDVGQECDISYEAPEIEIMKSSWKSRSGDVRTRPKHINHRLERLGTDHE